MVSNALQSWFQRLISERISAELYISLTENDNKFALKIGDDDSISWALIPALYNLGHQPDLPCAVWTPRSEGFSALEPLLPVPGLVDCPQPLVQYKTDGFHLDYDILGLTYWMLARCEEVNLAAELFDNHQRFPATASHAFKHGYLERPIVDEWFGILRQLISRLWPGLPLVQPQFKLLVSHDVDRPSAYAFGQKRQFIKNLAGDIFKRKAPNVALDRTLIRLRSRHHLQSNDPFNSFDWLMDTSEAVGICSAFYFICGRTNPSFDAQYEPEHPAIRHLLRRIHDRGHEIGLHPSYETCVYPARIAQEGKRMKLICKEEGIEQFHWGGRMHYLRWQWPTTAYGLEQAGLHYDSTLSYADCPGYRCGTCHPYQMFDPVAHRPLRLIQRPLIAMECSVISPLYLGLGYSHSSLALFLRLKQRCQAVGGQFTLLWHNSELSHIQAKSFYSEILNS